MEFKEILRRRRSVRKYLSRPVEREVLDTVLREALAAPSSRNSHSTHLRFKTASVLTPSGLIDGLNPTVSSPFYGIEGWTVHFDKG